MKKRNTQFTAILLVLAFALAPIVQSIAAPRPVPLPPATERPEPQPLPPANDRPEPQHLLPANERVSDSPEGENLPAITIHSTGNILRGKTGSFVVEMKPALMFGGTYVNFSVSGTAAAGVDYVALVSPTYIGQSGYGVISFATLPDPRAGSLNQAYSVVVTLQPGPGYALGESKSATIWIKNAQ